MKHSVLFQDWIYIIRESQRYNPLKYEGFSKYSCLWEDETSVDKKTFRHSDDTKSKAMKDRAITKAIKFYQSLGFSELDARWKVFEMLEETDNGK